MFHAIAAGGAEFFFVACCVLLAEEALIGGLSRMLFNRGPKQTGNKRRRPAGVLRIKH